MDKHDKGLELGRKLRTWLSGGRSGGVTYQYTPLENQELPFTDDDDNDGPHSSDTSVSLPPPPPPPPKPTKRRYTQRLPFRRIFTPNVTSTLTASFLLAFHVGTFNSLWFVFLSTPVYDPSTPPESSSALPRHLPFIFTGGLGLRPPEVGMAMAVLGAIGITLQLFVYPRLAARLGTVVSWRAFLVFFPIAYFCVPFLSLVPAASAPPHPKDGWAIWVALVGVISLQVLARTFALPAQTILVNNCSPHPSVLGTVHGVGQSVSSFARTVGPVVCGYLYGKGLAKGVVGAVFWGLSGVGVCAVVASLMVHEGDGHEIWLEGDDEDEEGLDA